MLPSLIVVTGAPGSGKSTVAQPLAARLQLPLIAKDDIKEALWEHVGAGDRDRFLEYGAASYPLMLLIARLILAAGKSAIVEANFTPEWAAAELARLHARTPFRFVQILCIADPETCLARYRERSVSDSRHPMHRVGGKETEISFEQRLRDGVWDRTIPFSGAVITLDTTRPVDLQAVADEVSSRMRATIAST